MYMHLRNHSILPVIHACSHAFIPSSARGYTASGFLRGYHSSNIYNLRNTQLAYQILQTLSGLRLKLLLRGSEDLLENGNEALCQAHNGRVLKLVW